MDGSTQQQQQQQHPGRCALIQQQASIYLRFCGIDVAAPGIEKIDWWWLAHPTVTVAMHGHWLYNGTKSPVKVHSSLCRQTRAGRLKILPTALCLSLTPFIHPYDAPLFCLPFTFPFLLHLSSRPPFLSAFPQSLHSSLYGSSVGQSLPSFFFSSIGGRVEWLWRPFHSSQAPSLHRSLSASLYLPHHSYILPSTPPRGIPYVWSMMHKCSMVKIEESKKRKLSKKRKFYEIFRKQGKINEIFRNRGLHFLDIVGENMQYESLA